ncbi:MAG: tRNA 2-thiouridine(34) synthase MnmA, partial [Gemmatimonadetes bacterium]|nr:tRNA 2-thiouridine(34) synthase MnmA [Gemmatimonadota bacterium]
PEPGESVAVRIRHGAPIVEAVVTEVGPDGFSLDLQASQDAVTPGQSAVLYRGQVVLGGGVITRSERT